MSSLYFLGQRDRDREREKEREGARLAVNGSVENICQMREDRRVQGSMRREREGVEIRGHFCGKVYKLLKTAK